MLNVKSSIVTFCFILLSVAAIAQPVAGFTASPTSGCYPLQVTFTNTSTGALTYSWNFGSAGSSTQTSPIKTFLSPGTYVVLLTAYNGSLQDTFSMVIYVYSSYPPSVNISASPGNTICAAQADTFTAVPALGGSSPSYQWKLNGSNVGSNSNIYTNNSLANSDVVTCVLTSNASCASPTTATSNAITMTVNTSVTPTLSVSGNNTVCAGTAVTYTASSNVGGVSYQWQVNGINAGANSSSYTYTPANGDIVRCISTMSGSCYTSNADTSNAITMTVNASVTPTISIVAGSNPVCQGTAVTFTASTNISGGTYHWLLNGSTVGTNSNSYNYTPTSGDMVKCVIAVPSGGCYSAATDTSNNITMIVSNIIGPAVGIVASNDPVCAGALVTITANTNISGGTYQWAVNGNNVGTNSNTYSFYPVNGDHVTCEVLTPSTGCYAANFAISGTLNMIVLPYVTPGVVLHGPAGVLPGNSVTINATVSNAGTAYSIVWRNKGVSFNTTTVPNVTYTKTAGTDSITAELTVTAPSGCWNIDTSAAWVVADSVTGVSNYHAGPNLLVYPNPFSSQLNVKGLQMGQTLCVYDLLGRRRSAILSIDDQQEQHSFSLGELPPGNYFLHVWDSKAGATTAVIQIQRLK